jgi:hypothetical protein
MDEERMAERMARAVVVAQAAWTDANRGLPSNPMTRAAAIPATGVLAAALLAHLDLDDATLTARARQAVGIARRAWQKTHIESGGNPIAATAEKSVIGILAAAILSQPEAWAAGGG